MTRVTILGLSLVYISALITPASSAAPRPDILLIMPDQMRGDCLSALDHPVVRTPTIDQLARAGTLFRRAYTTVPSCIPARYALMTGRFPQTSGVVGFKKKPVTSPTLPQVLRDSGYTTALVGREMHQIVGAKELGYDLDILGSTYVDDRYATELKQVVPGMKNIRAWVTGLGLTYNHWQARPWPLDNAWHPTTWIVNKARDVVASTAADRPLFLTASFYAPHPPLFPPPKYFDYYLHSDLPAPAHGDWVAWDTLTTKGRDGGHRVLLEGDTLRRAQAGYFGLIEHLDHEIAALIDDFKQRSEHVGRSWVIAVTSDHGEMLGDHGFFRKCEPLEGSANIPMVIAASSDLKFRTGQRSTQPVALEDLMPTCCALAGAPCPKVDGINLVPVLRGETETVRPWLHFEHSPCYSKAQAFHALTDGHAKYIWRPTDGTERLFDLDHDPHEVHDLAQSADAHQLLLKWRGVLIKRLANRPEGFSDGKRLISGRPYQAIVRGEGRGER